MSAQADELKAHHERAAKAFRQAARITRFDMSGLQLSVGDRTYISGPWKAGDQPVQHRDGMTSNWTIR